MKDPNGKMMQVPMSTAVREAVSQLRPLLGARSDAAAVRIAVAQLARAKGIALPGTDESDPDYPKNAPMPAPAAKKGGRPARKR